MNITRVVSTILCAVVLMTSSAFCKLPNFNRLDSLIKEYMPPAPVKSTIAGDVIILKVSGEVNVAWADSLEMVCKGTTNPTIIMWIESGGGGTQETAILTHRVETIKTKYHKTLIVYTERFLCSGAYWLAVVADSLYASPAAIVGSIGVYIARLDITAYDSLNGGKYDVIKTGKLKDAGDQHTKMTDVERAFWQEWVNKSFAEFIDHVYAHRERQLTEACARIDKDKTPRDMLLRLADGRVYTAQEALNFGLVDRVLYIDDMIAALGDNVVVKIVEVIPSNSGITHPIVK